VSVVYADVPSLLRLAESLPGDPQVDDLGPLFAAVARHRAVAMEREVYGSVWLQAASLLHTLARLPSLEANNRVFAWVSAQAFLAVNGHALDYKPPAAVALVLDVAAGSMGVQQIAVQLRAWTVS
jgi:prophage maintenance system killer protein